MKPILDLRNDVPAILIGTITSIVFLAVLFVIGLSMAGYTMVPR